MNVENEPNPFASPVSESQSPSYVRMSLGDLKLATSGQRFLNVFIDGFIYRVFSTIAAMAFGSVYYANGAVPEGPQRGWDTVDIIAFILGLAIFFAFYAICEAAFGKTPGKLVTGTRVVSDDGGIPTLRQIILRTACRLIPFEAFSFLGKDAVGWHDQLSKTRVIQN